MSIYYFPVKYFQGKPCASCHSTDRIKDKGKLVYKTEKRKTILVCNKYPVCMFSASPTVKAIKKLKREKLKKQEKLKRDSSKRGLAKAHILWRRLDREFQEALEK